MGQAYSAAEPATHLVYLRGRSKRDGKPHGRHGCPFEDYLRFRPRETPSNIWVTLATNSWSMDGSASLSGGLTRSNLPPASALVESEDFPSWTQTYAP